MRDLDGEKLNAVVDYVRWQLIEGRSEQYRREFVSSPPSIDGTIDIVNSIVYDCSDFVENRALANGFFEWAYEAFPSCHNDLDKVMNDVFDASKLNYDILTTDEPDATH